VSLFFCPRIASHLSGFAVRMFCSRPVFEEASSKADAGGREPARREGRTGHFAFDVFDGELDTLSAVEVGPLPIGLACGADALNRGMARRANAISVGDGF
jgi:hypothetical protein